ncbi:MAG: nucleotidyltransferase family protein [Pseudorhodoplanes sp.]|uniref:nucleotidyltransferase family protein n=1 Tax=Pseudorhodoplanes sp. TaxID=1934341 RepID=UPI003D0D2973
MIADLWAPWPTTAPASRLVPICCIGLHARDEARSDSDIDVFVDPVSEEKFGFLLFIDAYETLQKAVGENIDYGTRNGLHPLLRADIERKAVRIFRWLSIPSVFVLATYVKKSRAFAI